jgi:hypothetical protein
MQHARTGRDGRADFDFLMGRWNVQHRRLRERLKASAAWEEFAGTLIARPLLSGLGNIDESIMERASGRFEGVAVRFYNPLSQQWSIYWADNVSVMLQPPMVGGFVQGRGEFYDQELFEGRAIFSRFIWSDITARSCRWEQAFSEDGGTSWETNWVMDFTRHE